MSTADRIRPVVEPLVEARGFRTYDIEQQGPVLRVTVAAGTGEPPTIDDLSDLTRELSRRLDEVDPIDGRYTLEVSSPGLERLLRTPEHFAGAVGEVVSVKVRRTEAGGARRLRGVLRSAADDHVVVAAESADGVTDATIAYDEIDKARTVFEWGPTTKPGGQSSPSARPRRSTP